MKDSLDTKYEDSSDTKEEIEQSTQTTKTVEAKENDISLQSPPGFSLGSPSSPAVTSLLASPTRLPTYFSSSTVPTEALPFTSRVSLYFYEILEYLLAKIDDVMTPQNSSLPRIIIDSIVDYIPDEIWVKLVSSTRLSFREVCTVSLNFF